MLEAIIVAAVLLNQPEVKYCKNLTTGEIHVVEVNMPCPYPTVRVR